jgi:hypothetical protein
MTGDAGQTAWGPLGLIEVWECYKSAGGLTIPLPQWGSGKIPDLREKTAVLSQKHASIEFNVYGIYKYMPT